jgi:hypothetical protein
MRLDWQDTAVARIVAWEDADAIHQVRSTAVAPGWYFCPNDGHPFWYLNHSCKPNVAYRNWASYENGSAVPLVALQEIHVDDEVVIDYSTMTTYNDGEEEDAPWTMKCLCGASNCRRLLKDFFHLPRTLQMDMLLMRAPVCGIVPAFILNESQMLVDELRRRAPEMFEGYQSVLAMQFALAQRFELEYENHDPAA